MSIIQDMHLNEKIDNVHLLYFDYWLRGIRHFEKIDLIVKQYGLKSVLVHLGSQRGEVCDLDTTVSGIRALDISLFQNSLIKMLRFINPKVVLLLNNQTEDRIIIRACKNLGIKTVFLMHGVLAPTAFMNENSLLVNSAFGLKERLIRIPKYLKLVNQYIAAATLKRLVDIFDFEILQYFILQAYSPGGNSMGKWSYRDAYADYNLVYSESDKELFVKGFGSPADSVFIVGNYNLDDLYKKFEQNLKKFKVEKKDRFILYIENGSSNPVYNVKGWSEDLVAYEVESISKISAKFGFKLVVKLHPSSNYSTLIKRLTGKSNVEVIHHCDLAELLLNSSLVLGQFSSVIMMAIAVKKPIVILNIPPLPCLLNLYKDRGIGVAANSLLEFENYLSKFSEDMPNSDYSKVVESSLGPFDGLATKRITDFLIGVLKNKVECA